MLNVDIYIGEVYGMPDIGQLVSWINVSVMVVISAIFLWAVIFYVQKLMPILEEIKDNSERSTIMIENNTRAFNELSKSNENVAKALELLTGTLTKNADDIQRHEQDSKRNFDKAYDLITKQGEQIGGLQTEVSKLAEHVKLCTSIQQMKMYHGE